MSDYLESEAEESLDEEYEKELASLNKNKMIMSDDEEEEEGEDLDKDLEDLIDDNEVNEGDPDSDASDSSRTHEGKKRKKKKSLSDAELEDEDYDLIEENLGIKVQRKKFKRIMMDSDEGSDKDGSHNEGHRQNSRQAIAEQLFQDHSDKDIQSDASYENSISSKSLKHMKKSKQLTSKSNKIHEKETHGPKKNARLVSRGMNHEEEEDLQEENDEIEEYPEEGEESDMDDFIVDDDGKPIQKKNRRKKKFRHSDSTLQQAQDVFGCDFDFDDLEGSAGEFEEEEEFDDEREEEGEGKSKKRGKFKSIYEMYEPTELERQHLTDKDNLIRATDVPERFQLRNLPVTPTEEGELEEEADWIFKHAFTQYPISSQEMVEVRDSDQATDPAPGDLTGDGATDPSSKKGKLSAELLNYCQVGTNVIYEPKGPTAVAKIREALNFMRNQLFEVPFIAHYRKEYVEPDLNLSDLWRIFHWDERWQNLRTRKKNLLTLMEKVEKFMGEEVMKIPSQQLPDDFKAIVDSDFTRVKLVETLEEFGDVHEWFLLYYGKVVDLMKDSEERLLTAARKMRISGKSRTRKGPDPKAGGDNIFSLTADVDGDDRQNLDEAGDEDYAKDEENGHDADLDDIETTTLNKLNGGHSERLKKARKKDSYTYCIKAGLGNFAAKMGLKPSEFGENMRENYQKHEVEQCAADVYDLAYTFCHTPEATPGQAEPSGIKSNFTKPDDVIRGACHILAMQISRDPLVRKTVRTAFNERAKLTLRPTRPDAAKDMEDEGHSLFAMRYLRDKPVRDLYGDQFLKIESARASGLVEVKLGMSEADHATFFDEVRPLFERDEFSINARRWNDLRARAVEEALCAFLYPALSEELRNRLEREAIDGVLNACAYKLYSALKVGPYQVERPLEDLEEMINEGSGSTVKVLGLAYSLERDSVPFAAMVDGEGDVTDFLRLPNILKRKHSHRLDEISAKKADLAALRAFILAKKPHVVAVASESRDALFLQEDIKDVCLDLEQNSGLPPVGVTLVDNDLALVYQGSRRAIAEFPEYPPLLRQAISLARRVQDPLLEFCSACGPDQDLLCVKFHPLQDLILLPKNKGAGGSAQKNDFRRVLERVFVDRVNETGVDLNAALARSRKALSSGGGGAGAGSSTGNGCGNALQFCCGLGPRKAAGLLKTLRQRGGAGGSSPLTPRLENRTQLVTVCHMGPKVFVNCAGFIKIDTAALLLLEEEEGRKTGGGSDYYIEVLDSTRIHPETYEWARKMAVDALEYDDTAEDANPASALEEILESPDRLKDLDLDAFAEELERQGFGNKVATLYDIRSELTHRYKDTRIIPIPPSVEERFNLVTKETPLTFYIGKMVLVRVTNIAYRRPKQEQTDTANPVRNDETGLWQCPFCFKADFLELSEVWSHFDSGQCPGQPVGVRVRLDNGISGFIHIRNISDKNVKNPEDRVKIGMTLYARILKIDIDRFSVELSSKSSDLADSNNEFRPPKDLFYDYEAEESDQRAAEEKAKRKSGGQVYVKRVIAHPAFKNISYKEAENIMRDMAQGETIIRPSSKGEDHLTATWKVTDQIYQHIDIKEEGKEKAFTLGRSLWIGNEEFEDLYEIMARFIQPMASLARDTLNYKYYSEGNGGDKHSLEILLFETKRTNPSHIPYYFSASKEYPGKFLLSYLPRTNAHHEYVSITPEGFKYRNRVFPGLTSLIRWFKEHFREKPFAPAAIPTNTNNYQGSSTPNWSSAYNSNKY